MVVSDQYPRIGGCQRDKTLFYMGSNGGLCPFCAQAPDFVANLPVATAPFTDAGADPYAYSTAPQAGAGVADGMPSDQPALDTAAPAEPVDIPTACPSCGAHLRAVVSDDAFQLLPANPTTDEETPAEPAPRLDAAGESSPTEGAATADVADSLAPREPAAEVAASSGADAEAPV